MDDRSSFQAIAPADISLPPTITVDLTWLVVGSHSASPIRNTSRASYDTLTSR